MNIKDREKWVYLPEFFETVADQGIDEMEAADALLAALRSGLRANGHRRHYSYGKSGWEERHPRDIHPQPIPINLWRKSEEPKGDLTSFWTDDPDEPEEWLSIDWVSGKMESVAWELTPIERLRTDYAAIKVQRKRAEQLLGELAGRPKKSAGRPEGPSDPAEREKVAIALRMIGDGDARASNAIANDLTDSSLTGDALRRQQRRLTWGIDQAVQRKTKNTPKNI